MRLPKAASIILLGIVPIVLSACSINNYSEAPLQAQVLNGTEPVAGAAVIAYWELSDPQCGGEWCQESPSILKIEETVTDSEGRFSFPAWGPHITCCSPLGFNDPAIYVFKPGYFLSGDSDGPAVYKNPSFRNPYWNGKTIQIKRYTLDYSRDDDYSRREFKEYYDSFEVAADTEFNFLTYDPSRCDWKKVPHFLRALMEQIAIFKQYGFPSDISIINELKLQDAWFSKGNDCGSPKAYLEELEKSNPPT